jgi:hypothetical protein
LEKICSRNFLFIFSLKIAIYLSLGLHKDVQATGEVFTPQKRTSTTSKHEFSSLLWVILAFLDPDLGEDLDPQIST